MQAITDFGKIQTFFTKYRPNKDPFSSKGLYYRPRSLNKDPGGSTGEFGLSVGVGVWSGEGVSLKIKLRLITNTLYVNCSP